MARLNIEHLQKKLAIEADEAKRQRILRLLFEEEAKLSAIQAQSVRGHGARMEQKT